MQNQPALEAVKLRHPDRFEIKSNENTILYGHDQEWFRSQWQRLSGCGPTTASNLLRYMWKTRPGHEQDILPSTQSEAVLFQERVWRLVTPSRGGMPTAKRFYTSVLAYAQTLNWRLSHRVFEVPADRALRSSTSSLIEFLKKPIAEDTPVAFLNLCIGSEALLDEWHWVTLVGIETGKRNRLFANILDNGEFSRANLSIWHDTTTRGGGFVYFQNQP